VSEVVQGVGSSRRVGGKACTGGAGGFEARHAAAVLALNGALCAVPKQCR